MSQFPHQGAKPGGPPYQPYQQPVQQNSGGGNTLLIVLAIIGGVLLLGVGTCGVIAFMVTRSVNKMVGEISSSITKAMVDDVVARYEENEEVVSRIGVVEDFYLEDEDTNFIDLATARKIVIILEGENGTGELILYQKGSEPEKVTFGFNGEEVLLDDSPEDFHTANFEEEWDAEEWGDEGSVETESAEPGEDESTGFDPAAGLIDEGDSGDDESVDLQVGDQQ